jgi:hypothetical protein
MRGIHKCTCTTEDFCYAENGQVYNRALNIFIRILHKFQLHYKGTSLPLWYSRSNSKGFHMGSVVDKVALGWISLQLSSGAGTIDSIMAAVPRDPQPQEQNKKKTSTGKRQMKFREVP